MGVSLAFVFHVASALAVIFLAAWGLRLQRNLQFLRGLLASARANDSAVDRAGDRPLDRTLVPPRRIADRPARFVIRAARSFGVPVAGNPLRSGFSGSDEVVAIKAEFLTQIFLRGDLYLIQFSETRTIEFHLAAPSPVRAGDLEAAFSGAVRIKLIENGGSDAS